MFNIFKLSKNTSVKVQITRKPTVIKLPWPEILELVAMGLAVMGLVESADLVGLED